MPPFDLQNQGNPFHWFPIEKKPENLTSKLKLPVADPPAFCYFTAMQLTSVKTIFFLGGFLFAQCGWCQLATRPFPQHEIYSAGSILPNHITQQTMDDSVRSFYNQWKERYINNDCGKGQNYVWFEPSSGKNKCVSEGQGYGMMIVAMMAGYDSSAKTIYDGLFRYCRSHPSGRNAQLMSWAQTNDCHDVDSSSATDGDMDIAWSLLVADAQWGSSGTINYRREAITMINAIMQQEINRKTWSVLLSNEVEHDSEDYFDMRSSDFMPASFKAFREVTGDTCWEHVLDNNYAMFRELQQRFSSEAGLIPDFILNTNNGPRPPNGLYLESRNDGGYNYNACRIPWRIGTDYLLYGDQRAKFLLKKINSWIRQTTNNNPDNISAGYTLGGEDLKSRHFEALSFITPFAVSAMTDPSCQPWLNSLWNYTVHFDLDSFDYYDNSIKMISMLLLSGNYWNPVQQQKPASPETASWKTFHTK